MSLRHALHTSQVSTIAATLAQIAATAATADGREREHAGDARAGGPAATRRAAAGLAVEARDLTAGGARGAVGDPDRERRRDRAARVAAVGDRDGHRVGARGRAG